MNGTRKEIKIRTITYIGTALGLVVGLAWNEAITELINVLFPISKDSVLIKFGYAIILTIIVVLVVQQLDKLIKSE